MKVIEVKTAVRLTPEVAETINTAYEYFTAIAREIATLDMKDEEENPLLDKLYDTADNAESIIYKFKEAYKEYIEDAYNNW